MHASFEKDSNRSAVQHPPRGSPSRGNPRPNANAFQATLRRRHEVRRRAEGRSERCEAQRWYNFRAVGSATLLVADISTAAIVVAALGVLVVLPLVAIGLMYNRLVTLRVRVRNGYSQIDVQLRRRYDLIPNLVAAVQGYMQHERTALESVIEARANATQAANAAAATPGAVGVMGALAAANVTLDQSLGRLFGLVEAYPDLKASQNVLQLQEELVTTENRVAFARQAYNDAVMTYNTARQVVPSNLVASIFGFEEAALYMAEADSRALPSVRL